MSIYSKRDQDLLTEAYSVQLIRENAPNMSISQVQANLSLMSEAEAEYINTVTERIINEFFGGLKNLGSAVKQGVTNTASAAVQGVKNAGASALDTAKAAGQGALAAGSAIKANAANISNKGEIQQRQSKSAEQAMQSLTQLKQLLDQAKKDGVVNQGADVSNMTLTELIDLLQGASQSAATNAGEAAQGGFFKGAGQAASNAYKAASQPASAQ